MPTRGRRLWSANPGKETREERMETLHQCTAMWLRHTLESAWGGGKHQRLKMKTWTSPTGGDDVRLVRRSK